MKVINYKFQDGTSCEVEVSEELYLQIEQLDKKEKRNHWRETRRHESLEQLMEKGEDFCSDENPLEFLVEKENEIEEIEHLERLKNILSKLLPAQQELLNAMYFSKKSVTDFAMQKGVSRQAIQQRLWTILEKIKKIL